MACETMTAMKDLWLLEEKKRVHPIEKSSCKDELQVKLQKSSHAKTSCQRVELSSSNCKSRVMQRQVVKELSCQIRVVKVESCKLSYKAKSSCQVVGV